MNKGKLCFWCLMFVAAPVVVEGQTGPPPATANPAPAALPVTSMTEEEILAAHFRQFGDEYIAPLTVAEQAGAIGVASLTLWSGRLDHENYTISWDSRTGLVVSFNGQPAAIEVSEDAGNHLNWQASVVVPVKNGRRVKESLETRSGFVVATGESFVIQIEAKTYTYRFEKSLMDDTVAAGYIFPEFSARCACVTTKPDKPKGACAGSQNCDRSDGCAAPGGDPNATCNWRAN